MDYLDDLMLIRNALQQKDYMQVINYLKTIILGNQGYVLQGRIYHNLLYMIEAFMKEELVIYLMRDMFDEDDNLLHEYMRSEEHTSELQSRGHIVCRLLLEKNNPSRTAPQIAYTQYYQ